MEHSVGTFCLSLPKSNYRQEGVRIDQELARKASVVYPIASANLAPSAKVEEVRSETRTPP
jgi:hypothetical protein